MAPEPSDSSQHDPGEGPGNESDHDNYPPGKPPSRNSVQAAADFIAAGARTIREASPGTSGFSAEFAALLDYCEAVGLELDAGIIPATPLDAGKEHCVWMNTAGNRVLKATQPNKFGIMIQCDACPNGHASPYQYFERMRLTNEVFGDDIRLEGFAKIDGKIRTIISQPFISGRLTNVDEIVAFMALYLFRQFESEGTVAWYRAEDNLVAFDAHTRNFLTTDENVVVPIDVIVFRPDEVTRAQIESILPPVTRSAGAGSAHNVAG